jgi:hypothetical protein
LTSSTAGIFIIADADELRLEIMLNYRHAFEAEYRFAVPLEHHTVHGPPFERWV